MRQKLMEKNLNIDETTPFRQYVDAFSELVKDSSIQPVATIETELQQWDFAKTDKSDWVQVTLPHSCNMADCRDSNMFRGITWYKQTWFLSAEDMTCDHYLKLEQATMCANIYVNDTLVYYHSSGYAPCTVKLTGLKEGQNLIYVECNNKINYDICPISADFSFPNGLIGLAYHIKSKNVYLDPIKYGVDKAHITQKDVSALAANFKVECAIHNSFDDYAPVVVKIKANDTILSTDNVKVDAGEVYDYAVDLSIDNPHLWQGREDPYLYDISIELSCKDVIIDTLHIPTGFRSLIADHYSGLFLNGKPIRLWGAGVHQDTEAHFAAMTHADYENNYTYFDDIGMNYLRLAHYPHNVYDYTLADQHGYLTEVEIPWINNCPLNCSDAFKASINQYVKDMIVNLYNHTSIALWGISNELGGNHAPISSSYGGGYSKDLAIKLNNAAYLYARTLDQSRPIGLQTTASVISNNFLGDWMAFNTYDLWYTTNASQQTNTYNNLHSQWRYIDGISEYGAGANIDQQSENWLTEEEKGSSGGKHFESYQSYVHEIQMDKIIPLGTMGVCAIWAFFDFPAYPRSEGGTKGLNDKGLMTRNRQIKKDAYYLYKAYWNKTDPMVHIKDKRIATRTSNMIAITAYSNCDYVELYRNGALVQQLGDPTDSINGVIWTFDTLQFYNERDYYEVKGFIDGVEVASDTADFTTTGTYLNIGLFCRSNIQEMNFIKTNPIAQDFILESNCNWNVISVPDWLTVTPSNGTIDNASTVINISAQTNDTGVARSAEITFSPVVGASVSDIPPVSCVITVNQSAADVSYLGYVQLSSLSDYIDTGYIPNENSKVEVKAYIDGTAKSRQIFGCRSSSSSTDRFAYFLDTNVHTINPMYGDGSLNDLNISLPINQVYTLSIKQGSASYNGTEYPISYTTRTISPYTLWLFCTNQANAIYGHAELGMKLYYCKIYESDVLIHDYCPAVDNDGNVSLYDEITKTYLHSQLNTMVGDQLYDSIEIIPNTMSVSSVANTQTAKVKYSDSEQVSILGIDDAWLTASLSEDKTELTVAYEANPNSESRIATITLGCGTARATLIVTQDKLIQSTGEYTPLLYLASNEADHPYIDTRLFLDSSYVVETKCQFSKYDAIAIFGARSATNNLRYAALVDSKQRYYLILANNDNSTGAYYTWHASDGAITIRMSMIDAYIGDQHVGQSNPGGVAAFTTACSMYLFAENQLGTPKNITGTRTIYYLKVFEADGITLVASYIPVLDSNGIPCIYEEKAGIFLYSQNDGVFSYGTIS